MKLKDAIKLGFGLAIGWRFLDAINEVGGRALGDYFRSDNWKELYNSMSEDTKEIFKSFKPEYSSSKESVTFGFQDSKSSGSK